MCATLAPAPASRGVERRGQPGALAVRLSNDGDRRFHGVGRHQRDRATAEACAGEPCAVTAGLLAQQRHHGIQLQAADFIQIAQAGVRCVHQAADRRQIAFAQRDRQFPRHGGSRR